MRHYYIKFRMWFWSKLSRYAGSKHAEAFAEVLSILHHEVEGHRTEIYDLGAEKAQADHDEAIH